MRLMVFGADVADRSMHDPATDDRSRTGRSRTGLAASIGGRIALSINVRLGRNTGGRIAIGTRRIALSTTRRIALSTSGHMALGTAGRIALSTSGRIGLGTGPDAGPFLGPRLSLRAFPPKVTPPAPGTAFADGDDPDPGSGSELAGRLLSLASLLPALLATAWIVAGFPLAALGLFRPAFVVPCFLIVAVILVPLGLSLVRRSAATVRGPWWSLAATTTIAIGFTLFTALSHSEHVIPRRDAGSYAQIGYWLAHHGSPFYDAPLAAFGPVPGQLSFASPAFYQHGSTVVPQFMTGWPELLAGANWAGGWTGLLLLPTIVGGCAILAVGGLAARLMGARWAPLAALLTAGAWPVLRAAQETLSEPLALLMLTAGTCLLVDLVLAARQAGAGGALAGDTGLRRLIRRHSFAAGLLLTASELVRLDFGVDFAFVLPILGWLWWTRRPGVGWFLVGALIGAVLGTLDAAYVTNEYVKVNWSSVRLMLLLLTVMPLAVAVIIQLVRHHGRSPHDMGWWRWVPLVGAGVVLLAEVGLFVRPWVLVDHSQNDPGVMIYIGQMQRELGLAVDGSRGYAEASLRWVAWYVGWAAVAAAGAAAVFLVWRVLNGRNMRWLPVLLVYLCTAVLTLVRPGITPDHPWADRRLVVEVMPCVALLATWTTAALARWAVRRLCGTATEPPDRVAALLPVGLVVAVVLSFAIPMGVALAPISVQRTEQGELAAIDRVCSTLQPNDTVLLIDPQWTPVIRSQCGLPVAQLLNPTPVTVTLAATSIRSIGRTPVVAGSQMDSPVPLALDTSVVIDLTSREDDKQLVHRPDTTVPLYLQFWLAYPAGP
jgi:hypothetical protein